VLKAMLAIQHSCIPANLHFNKLSPSVEPFYNNLEILRRSTPWPRLTAGEVRRASVNSFGFGGTNAHAIIESYEQPISNPSAHTDAIQTVLCPFVFSAASEKALRGNVAAYIDYLDSNENCDAHDLAYTLRERRSVLQYRLAVPAPSCTTLREMLATFLSGQQDGIKMVRTQPKLGRTSSKILGVFTGQGAQYAAMGAHIIHNSIFARDVIRKLQSYLMELPEQDQPSWSMEKELLADSDNSRVSDSSISQPLNTAIQIMLVDLLGLANVHFDVVVGHSSGEIAAAYAAGFLSARDGMCISYYRGICCQYAQSPNGGTGGSMLAAGTSMADALELIRDETFRDRISLAAVNSPSSVTISGDTDAIEELALVMEDEGKFYRKLHVDKAYHSQHMKACIEPYATGMKRAGICSGSPRPPTPGRACQWYSSVYNGKLVDESFDLSSSYWIENLVNPVMFESALSAALKAQCIPFDAVLEIGPHPALQGPSTHIMQDILKKPVPYHGTLNRNIDSLTAISTTLGFLWSELGRVGVELGRFERLSVGKKDATFRLLKDLPRYQWNHDTSYWSESRRSRHMRTRSQAVHPLLGHLTPESGPHAMRWKHVLKPSEMPWLVGHAVQNQVVFPAAGYICTAIEASRFLPINDESIQIMELDDFIIHQAVPFQSEDDGIEILVELSQILRSGDGITTRFSYSAALGGPTGSTDFSLVATATIHVQLGECSPHLLPERLSEPPHMIDVKSQRLYDQLAKLEYNFSGPFCSLVKLRRKLGFSRCIGQKADRLPDCSDLLVHPADLDAAFQAVNLAFSYPGDEQLRYLHLPTRISSIRINPAALQNTESHFNVDATWNQPDPLVPTSGFSGNARLYFGDAELQSAGIQVDDVVLKPIGDANEERKIFHRLEYVPTRLDGEAAAEQTACSEYERELMHLVDRMGNFYAVQFDRDVPSDSRVRVEEGVLKHYLHFCHHLSEELVNGGNKFSRPEWIDDTEKDVMDAIDRLGYVCLWV
jgi:acyl transferase domain-containing protein